VAVYTHVADRWAGGLGGAGARRLGDVGVTVELFDLGHGHVLQFTAWAPDRDLNPQYDGIPDIERYGAIVEHTRPDGQRCVGGVTFDTEQTRAVRAMSGPAGVTWTVESWDPLTLSPSLLCSCGDHGFIRSGAWAPA
jgi:hypothetical protein